MKSAIAKIEHGEAPQKHTPGPWRITETRSQTGSKLKCIERAVPARDGINSLVAVLPDRCPSASQWEPNARLVAAAPELLAFAFHVLESGACAGIPGLEGYAHLVIAKALGGPVEPTQERAEFVRQAIRARGES